MLRFIGRASACLGERRAALSPSALVESELRYEAPGTRALRQPTHHLLPRHRHPSPSTKHSIFVFRILLIQSSASTHIFPQHGRLRFQQPQPQCRPPRPGCPAAQSHKYRNDYRRLPVRRRSSDCSRHTSNKWAHSGRQGATVAMPARMAAPLTAL